MRDMAGIDFPLARIFSQTVSGRPKGEVLNKLSAQYPEASELIFVEDKLSTLEKVRRGAGGRERRGRLVKVVVCILQPRLEELGL
jgi:hypothetical protein